MGSWSSEVRELTLAALLHDIGKVVQRAQDNPRAMTHSEWGAKWLSERFPRDSKVILAAAYHHAGTKPWDKGNFTLLIYQADNWASSEREIKRDKDPNYQWDAKAPLATPFSRISLKEERVVCPAFWPAHELTPLPPIATNEWEDYKISREDYECLLAGFENDFVHLSSNGLYPDALLMLLEKYFSFVPSETLVPKKGLKSGLIFLFSII